MRGALHFTSASETHAAGTTTGFAPFGIENAQARNRVLEKPEPVIVTSAAESACTVVGLTAAGQVGVFGGEADAIIDGKTGYLCDGNDLNALYETLLKTIENENYKKLGNNALVFSRNFNWNKIIKKYIELI